MNASGLDTVLSALRSDGTLIQGVKPSSGDNSEFMAAFNAAAGAAEARAHTAPSNNAGTPSVAPSPARATVSSGRAGVSDQSVAATTAGNRPVAGERATEAAPDGSSLPVSGNELPTDAAATTGVAPLQTASTPQQSAEGNFSAEGTNRLGAVSAAVHNALQNRSDQGLQGHSASAAPVNADLSEGAEGFNSFAQSVRDAALAAARASQSAATKASAQSANPQPGAPAGNAQPMNASVLAATAEQSPSALKTEIATASNTGVASAGNGVQTSNGVPPQRTVDTSSTAAGFSRSERSLSTAANLSERLTAASSATQEVVTTAESNPTAESTVSSAEARLARLASGLRAQGMQAADAGNSARTLASATDVALARTAESGNNGALASSSSSALANTTADAESPEALAQSLLDGGEAEAGDVGPALRSGLTREVLPQQPGRSDVTPASAALNPVAGAQANAASVNATPDSSALPSADGEANIELDAARQSQSLVDAQVAESLDTVASRGREAGLDSSTQARSFESVFAAGVNQTGLQSNQARAGETTQQLMSSLPDMNTAPESAEFPEEMISRLRLLQTQGAQEAKINLHPQELGRMQISISTEGDNTRVAFTVENPQAREALEQAMPRLREMLNQAGLQLADSSVAQQQAGQQFAGFEGDSSEQRGGASGGSATEGSGDEVGTRATRAVDPDRALDAYA